MKKICISFLVLTIIVLGIAYLPNNSTQNTEYLRIHIRADSNDEQAQAVKYKVKDAVTQFLTPYIAECDTKSKADETLELLLGKIERVADRVLENNGFSYRSKAKLNTEKFPTRVYDGLVLESGFYDALIIELGSGKGDNWWCVVYPPLCFKGVTENIVYKSKIIEIINEFFKRRQA